MTRFLLLTLLGAFLVMVAATFLAHHFLPWYARPPVPIGVSCDSAIVWAMNKMIIAQASGLAVGAVGGGLYYFRSRRASAPLPEMNDLAAKK